MFHAAHFGPIGWLFGLAVYFAPTIVAAVRRHERTWMIALINFFLGWTLIGWFGALIWACVGKAQPRAG